MNLSIQTLPRPTAFLSPALPSGLESVSGRDWAPPC